MRKSRVIVFFLAPLLAAVRCAAQDSSLQPPNSPFDSRVFANQPDTAMGRTSATLPIVDEIVFVGLRRISPAALEAKMVCRDGEPFSPAQVEHDVRTLALLGWFETVRVESTEISDSDSGARSTAQRVRLTFVVPELPFLTGVEYRASRLLSRPQIEKFLAEKKLTPKLGEPENRTVLDQGAREIESALRELAHPHARVEIHEEVSAEATLRVRFEINDGAHIPVGQVRFIGNPAISDERLRRQMRQLRPTAMFAGLRGKSAYTQERFEDDRNRLLTYYQNHGYPEARIGVPNVSQFEKASGKLLPWPRHSKRCLLRLVIPVEAGPLYRIDSVRASETLQDAAVTRRRPALASGSVRAGQPYSAQATEDLRRAWQMQLRGKLDKRDDTLVVQSAVPLRTVEVTRTLDTATHSMRINFHLSDSPPYIVQRLEFLGMHRFPDRYFRKRIVLKEGAPLDERALEAGLARLGRTGYFKPIKKEDVDVETNDVTRTAEVTIHVEELGKQRISLVGGRGQFGSTLGIAYMLYNVLDREELLSSRLEGGPETLQLALGFAKEGFLGSRGTLALSVFNTLMRPRLTGTVKGPFFKQQTEGLSSDWSYALTTTATMSVDYSVSHSKTQYSLGLPAGLAALPASDIRADSSSHSLGLGWERNTGRERIAFQDSVSGGLLGGSENLLRTKAEYGRIFHDPIFNSRNAWAFRTSFSATGSYSGTMPVYAREFAGDQFVRGLRDGELGPLGVVSSISSSGSTLYSAAPMGANAISAINVEYRVRLGPGTEAATFYDLGSGRLQRNWLAGTTRPSIIDATNGMLHGSTGVELRWTLPSVGVPVRVYYALNVLRLNQALPLPDGSLFRAHNRFSTLGWGLGSMF